MQVPLLNALRTFTVSAQRLNFTKAAEDLLVSPSAVSHQIKVLEEFLPAAVDPSEIRTAIRQAIEGGAKYLKQQLDRFGGDVTKALAAYNAGASRVDRWSQRLGVEDPEIFAERIRLEDIPTLEGAETRGVDCDVLGVSGGSAVIAVVARKYASRVPSKQSKIVKWDLSTKRSPLRVPRPSICSNRMRL